MRIAQIAPLHEAVPPKLYGGTERVVSFLTEELVAQGHEVTLFASGDSVTSARLHPVWPRALRLDPSIRDPIAPHMLLMEEVYRQAADFDVLHFHMDYWPFKSVLPAAHAVPHNPAWPAGPARAEASLQDIPGGARCVHQQCAVAGRCRKRVSWPPSCGPAGDFADATEYDAKLSGVPGPDRA